jgi:ParB family chromosome partitioning protein
MSKRTDAIRRLFTAEPAPAALSADNKPPPRVAAGAVRSMKDTFSDIERENAELRARVGAGEQVVEIDPALVDPSPFADRFSGEDDPSFEQLRQSIAERGQEIPILLRVHPSQPGRYQTAFGHRRLRAARLLGRPVKAILRALDDDDLVVAQGVENAAREDLSFIERAVFALRLETAGRSRAVIQQALAIDKAEASKLIAVARAVPEPLARAIGKAPRIGRGRWQEFADAAQDRAALRLAEAAARQADFAAAPSDERFARALAAAKGGEKGGAGQGEGAGGAVTTIRDRSGAPLAEMRAGARDLRLRLARKDDGAFARFLGARLPGLFDEFRASAAPAAKDD